MVAEMAVDVGAWERLGLCPETPWRERPYADRKRAADAIRDEWECSFEEGTFTVRDLAARWRTNVFTVWRILHGEIYTTDAPQRRPGGWQSPHASCDEERAIINGIRAGYSQAEIARQLDELLPYPVGRARVSWIARRLRRDGVLGPDEGRGYVSKRFRCLGCGTKTGRLRVPFCGWACWVAWLGEHPEVDTTPPVVARRALLRRAQ